MENHILADFLAVTALSVGTVLLLWLPAFV